MGEGHSTEALAFIRELPDGSITLPVYVQPRSSQNTFSGIHGNSRLKVRLTSPPVHGEANRALISYISKTLKVPKNSIELSSGEGSRQKLLRLTGVSCAEIKARLLKLLEGCVK